MDDIVFNVLLLKGEDGNSITSIEKTGTSGNTDTYTVTLTDGSTSTFYVTNGNGITSIEKTGTSGNTDTYTITLDNGNTATFTVTNGTNAVDDALSATSTNPVENRVVTNAINNINQHLKYTGTAQETDFPTAVQTIVKNALVDKSPVVDGIIDIVGQISRTTLGSTAVFYSSLGCARNAMGRLTAVGFATTSEVTMYKVSAVCSTASAGWSTATVTVTEV